MCKKSHKLIASFHQALNRCLSVAETRPNRLIDVKDVSNIEPGASRVPANNKIIVGGAVPRDLEGPVLREEPEHTGRSGASIDPYHQGDLGVTGRAAEEPVEEVVCGAGWEGARVEAGGGGEGA